MKKIIILIVLLFLSILNSCTILTYKYKTQEKINQEKLKDFEDFFNNFQMELIENNGSIDVIKKNINYSTISQQYYSSLKIYQNRKKSLYFILLYTNFISSISAEYNEISMLSLENNYIYRNKNSITWGLRYDFDYDGILLYRNSDIINEYPIGCIFKKSDTQWKIVEIIRVK